MKSEGNQIILKSEKPIAGIAAGQFGVVYTTGRKRFVWGVG
jgi:hypothetical protein